MTDPVERPDPAARGPARPWTAGRLDNGLRVFVQTSSAAPVSAVYLWLECGTADEPEGLDGAAHFLEHIVFKGTARRGVGRAAADIEALGGDLNAYTTWDQTVLHATVAAPWWSEALDVIADLAQGPSFDPAEFEREKHVVIDEIRGYDDDPESVADDAMQALLYPKHAYGRPILGTAASVQGLKVEDVRAFWKRGWAPNRAILAVAGPMSFDEVVAEARRQFAGWAPQADRPAIPQAPLAGGAVQKVARDFESTTVQLGWRIPGLGHADLPALDVLAAILGQGQSSLLTQRLQLQEQIAASCWADTSARLGGGSFAIGFLPMLDETAEATRRALEVVARVSRAGLPGAVVARARDAMVADFLFSHETVDGIAHDLAWYTARMGAPDAREAWRDALARVTPDDITRVTRTWLTPERATVVAVDAKLTPRDLQEAVGDGRRRWKVSRATPTYGQVARFELDNGARIVVLPDEGEICAVRTLSLGGCLAQTDRNAGIPSAWAAMVTAGAGPYDASGYGAACDNVATVSDAVAGRNTIGMQASFPVANLDDAIELLIWPLLDPHFSVNEWDRVQGELQEELRTLDDRPAQIASRKMWSLLWPGHPWRFPWGGTIASLGKLSTTALDRWHRQLVAPQNLVVAVAGGVHPEVVRDALAPWLEELGQTEEGAAPPHVGLDPRPDPGLPARGHRTFHAGHEQATVVACTRGAALSDPDRHALTMAATILGAQGGRMFLDLREARSLGYSVWASHADGLDGGVFQAGLATDPERAAEASEALVAELVRFTREGPTADEVERARRMLLGQRAMTLQRAAGRATDLAATALYGLPWGLDTYRRELEAVDAEAIRRVLHARGVDDPLVLTVLPR